MICARNLRVVSVRGVLEAWQPKRGGLEVMWKQEQVER